MKRTLLVCTLLSFLAGSHSFAGTLTVTNTYDGGPGSLRYALAMCAASVGPHTILFNIPTSDPGYRPASGVWVISPTSDFTIITRHGVTIDGSSQTAFAGNTNPTGPEIVVDGGGSRDYGFRFFNASHATLIGLNIRRFTKGAQFYNTPCSAVRGCYIGVDESGTAIAGNDIGLEFIAGSDSCTIGGDLPSDRNIVSGNFHIGIRLLDVRHCHVAGNLIGTDRTGTVALPNYDGMSMEGAVQHCTIGGTTAAQRNIISGNTDYGLPLFGVGATGNIVVGNYIGTDISGTRPLGNTYGVLFDDGSYGNRVGGPTDAERNIISGNVGYGVFFYNNGTHSNILRNNYIGTDVSGTAAVPNTAGIIIDGISYSNVMDSNIVSGNLQVGIGINISGSDSNVITRNRIGIDVHSEPLPNGMDGIRISQGPKRTRIGGDAHEGNIIAHNGGCGVYITNASCVENRISCNTFYGNGSLAIDLFAPGVTPNDNDDNDDGANHLLNFPVIASAASTGGAVVLTGTLPASDPATVEVQIYRADPDPTSYGEGARYLASVHPAADGSWTYTCSTCSDTDYFTALSIDPSGNTSEFSQAVGSNGPAPVVQASIASDPQGATVTVAPNPTDAFVAITADAYEGRQLLLYNLDGCQLGSTVVVDGQATFDLTRLPSGIYLLRFPDRTLKIIRR